MTNNKVLIFFQGKSQGLTKLFEKNGFEVIEVLSTKQAKTILEDDHEIDIIIEVLGNIADSSFKFLKFTKLNHKFKYIPYFIICNTPNQELINKCVQNGANDIIIDTSDEKMVFGKVEKAIAIGKRKVLIVDDDEMILDYLKFVIALERFKVYSASTGEKALEILKDVKIHAIISDIMMPGMSGLELLTKVKEDFDNIPVLLISGYAGRSEQECLQAGAVGFLKKPFKNTDLVKTIRQMTKTY